MCWLINRSPRAEQVATCEVRLGTFGAVFLTLNASEFEMVRIEARPLDQDAGH